MSEWTTIAPPPRCDLCTRLAVFAHPDGGRRCMICPRPGPDGADEATPMGVCSACSRTIMLTPTGLIMKHSAPGRYDRCPGSKHRPLDRNERGDAA